MKQITPDLMASLLSALISAERDYRRMSEVLKRYNMVASSKEALETADYIAKLLNEYKIS